MSIEEWAKIQTALSDAFSGGPDNVIGGEKLARVMEEESAYGFAIVQEFKGYDVLEHSFFEFLIETLELAAQGSFRGQLPEDDKHYTILYLTFLSVFRNFRAAATLKNHGYPMRGFSLLRDLKDRAFQLGAVVNGFTNILALRGFDPIMGKSGKLADKDSKKVRADQKTEQSTVMKLMVGTESGLALDDIAELEVLRDMYHEEVHGSKLSFIDDLRIVTIDQRLPDFGPRPHHHNYDASMYINRACEIGWMVLRSTPYLQLEARAFGADWVEKWTLLDEAFRMQVESLAGMGKKIGPVFLRMVDAKFAFDPETFYQSDTG